MPQAGRSFAVLVATSSNTSDGIRDHTECLVATLREDPEVEVRLWTRPPSAWRNTVIPEAGAPDTSDGHVDAILVQYNPFWHGRRGFAPGLISTIVRLRRHHRGVVVGLVVHEVWVTPRSWKWALMGLWQRVQLVALQLVTQVQFVSIEEWARKLQRTTRGRVEHLPVGSNLPDRRLNRAVGRELLGADDSMLVITAFGMLHPGRLTDYIIDAARAVVEDGCRVILLDLGSDARRGDEASPLDLEIRRPGYLPAEDVATLLAASDIFLAPFADGVSTRRTTMIAALQHGIATVGTDGHLTDQVLRDATEALTLVPVQRRDLFVAAVRALAGDPDERRARGQAARQLHDRTFGWPIIARQMTQSLDSLNS
jgi:glycosyltransferase involved in cell wall biosynthesis